MLLFSLLLLSCLSLFQMVSFLSLFLSISLTLLRSSCTQTTTNRSVWTWRTISASKSLLMPAFLPACLEMGKELESLLKDIFSSFLQMCINLNWYYFIIGRSMADKRAISNDLCVNRVNWPGDVFTIENSDWNKWPCVANCGGPYILVLSGYIHIRKRMKMANSSWVAVWSQKQQWRV